MLRKSRLTAVVLLSTVRCLAVGLPEGERLFEGTHPAVSPDGRRIAFQCEREGKLDLGVYDCASKQIVWVDARPGNACFPAWGRDGALVYAYGHPTNTAYQMMKRGAYDGYHVWRWREGTPLEQLTSGSVRDYTPSVDPVRGTVYFASTRDVPTRFEDGCTRVGLWRLGVAGQPECVVPAASNETGLTQPVVSPDGRFLAWSEVRGFAQLWILRAARLAEPSRSCVLTPNKMIAYAPVWSPDGRHLACTGFRVGDPSWCIYLVEPKSGAFARVAEGENPSWMPDGRTLVFDRDGVVCRLELADDVWPKTLPACAATETQPARSFRPFTGGTNLMDLAFGLTPCTIRLSGTVPAGSDEFVHLFRIEYKESFLGLQVYLKNGKPHFATRASDTTWLGIEGHTKLVPGKPFTITAMRTFEELVMQVDDGMPLRLLYGGKEDILSLDHPVRVRQHPDVKSVHVSTELPRALLPVSRAEIFGEAAP